MRWLEWIVALIWLATGASLATRTYFVFNYAAYANLPPHLEVIGFPLAVVPILLLALVSLRFGGKAEPSSDPVERRLWGWRSTVCLLVACVPLGTGWLTMILRPTPNGIIQVGVWEPILFAVMTGLAHYWSDGSGIESLRDRITKVFESSWHSFGLLCVFTMGVGTWWFLQSKYLFDSFQLGFNDFGHFLLRVIHTARGQGFLMEAPFLPTYWDHFNPGVALLVPLWWIWPKPELVFFLQAFALAGSSLLVYGIALAHRLGKPCAALWGVAWLFYPSVGQMNVAYTYGWHPISFSIPCLLAAYWLIMQGRTKTAIVSAILACSFEEGAIAAVGCFAAMRAIRGSFIASIEPLDDQESSDRELTGINAGQWAVVWLLCSLGFLAIYRWSGLAPFQTGRFAKLGSSAIEICLSPVLRPSVFFGLLFRSRNLVFLLFLISPFAVLILRSRFLWALVAATPLFLVLLLWEHMPAQSLAFQYASVILPILFLGAIEGSCRFSAWKSVLSVFAIGWTLSLFVGQFPWSGDTLADVKSRSYPPVARWTGASGTRAMGSSDHRVFHQQIRQIRSELQGGSNPFERSRVLATGRLAGHCLGALELETVGQFFDRFSDYRKLYPDLSSPVLHYDLILLDPIEGFQQTKDQTKQIREMALSLGFELTTFINGFDVLKRPYTTSEKP
jgi:uncharacterized membrane protein